MGKPSDIRGGITVASTVQNDPWTFSKNGALDMTAGSSFGKQQVQQTPSMWNAPVQKQTEAKNPWGPVFKNKQNFAEMHLF